MPFRPLIIASALLSASCAWADAQTVHDGEVIFKMRCVVCHGVNADGRSDLARIMKPPPANLRVSKLTDAQRSTIVRKGGEAVGRSSNMPTWELELDERELQSVLAYVKSLKGAAP